MRKLTSTHSSRSYLALAPLPRAQSFSLARLALLLRRHATSSLPHGLPPYHPNSDAWITRLTAPTTPRRSLARAWHILPSPPRPPLRFHGRVLMFPAFNADLLAATFVCPALFADICLCALRSLPLNPLTGSSTSRSGASPVCIAANARYFFASYPILV